MSDENPIIPEPDGATVKKGPFGVDAVDPIVYIQSTDNPELRFAAKNIPTFNDKVEIRQPVPSKPKRRNYTEWIPGFKGNHNQESPGRRGFGQAFQIIIGMILFAIPIAVLILIIKIVMNLYS